MWKIFWELWEFSENILWEFGQILQKLWEFSEWIFGKNFCRTNIAPTRSKFGTSPNNVGSACSIFGTNAHFIPINVDPENAFGKTQKAGRTNVRRTLYPPFNTFVSFFARKYWKNNSFAPKFIRNLNFADGGRTFVRSARIFSVFALEKIWGGKKSIFRKEKK